MALESEIVRKQYSGNGSTTNFSFPYYFLDATDLDVYTVDTTTGTPTVKAYVTDYDVVGSYSATTLAYDDFSSGASINFVSAPASTVTVVIVRNNPDTQDTSFTNNAAYQSSVVETAFDKLAMMIQYLASKVSRSIGLKDSHTTTTFSPALPDLLVADCTIAIDPTGTSIVMGPTVTNLNLAVTAGAAAAASAAAAALSASSASTYATNASNSAIAAAASAALVPGYFPTGSIVDTTFTLVNNQAVAANVTGLLFTGTTCRTAEFDAAFYINTTGGGATEMSARAKYVVDYKPTAASWDIAPIYIAGDVDASLGMPAGITLSITSAGQVQYTSTNVTGTAGTSQMRFRAVAMGV